MEIQCCTCLSCRLSLLHNNYLTIFERKSSELVGVERRTHISMKSSRVWGCYVVMSSSFLKLSIFFCEKSNFLLEKFEAVIFLHFQIKHSFFMTWPLNKPHHRLIGAIFKKAAVWKAQHAINFSQESLKGDTQSRSKPSLNTKSSQTQSKISLNYRANQIASHLPFATRSGGRKMM